MLNKIVSLAVVGCGSLAFADPAFPWDPPTVFKAVSGVQYTESLTDALSVKNEEIWRVEGDGVTAPTQLGSAKLWYSQPVTWKASETQVYFSDNPSESPTGFPVVVTATVVSLAYDVVTPGYAGFVVGLGVEYTIFDGVDSTTEILFDPDAFAGDHEEAFGLFKRLGTGTIFVRAVPNLAPNGDPECISACEQDYRTAVENANDEFATRSSLCGDLLVGGAVGGCLAGAGICSFIPPASNLACCIGGGILGGAGGYFYCVWEECEMYDLLRRQIDRDFLNCLTDCGVVSH